MPSFLVWFCFFVAAAVLLPVAALIAIAARADLDLLSRLAGGTLSDPLFTTLALMAWVALATGVVGVGTAWLITLCDFPGRRVLDIALVAPIAIPTYIAAYCLTEVFDLGGPVYRGTMALIGTEATRAYFPDIRSFGGAVAALSAVLYPYVYLTTRTALVLQSRNPFDVARTLGARPWRSFFQVGLPILRVPAAAGIALALMEVVNDIGAVEFFGVRTLTFTVYDLWLNRSSLPQAALVASVTLLLIVGLVWLEQRTRMASQPAMRADRMAQATTIYYLSRGHALLAVLACAAPLLIGFGLPLLVLLRASLRRPDAFLDPIYLDALLRTAAVGAVAALWIVATGALLAYALRSRRGRATSTAVAASGFGYALPGTVLAVGLLFPLAGLDNFLDGLWRSALGTPLGLIVTGSGLALVYAYLVRFLPVALSTLRAGFDRISPHLDVAARTLGHTERQSITAVLFPLARPALAGAALLVFIDIVKELPATLILRPFGFETLATRVYTAASLESFEDAAPAALTIALVGLIPVLLLARARGATIKALRG